MNENEVEVVVFRRALENFVKELTKGVNDAGVLRALAESTHRHDTVAVMVKNGEPELMSLWVEVRFGAILNRDQMTPQQAAALARAPLTKVSKKT